MDLTQSTIDFPIRKTRSQVKRNLNTVLNCDENLSPGTSQVKNRKQPKKRGTKVNLPLKDAFKTEESLSPLTTPEKLNPDTLRVSPKFVLCNSDRLVSSSPLKRPGSTKNGSGINLQTSPLKRVKVLDFDDENATPRALVKLGKQDVTPYQKAKQALHTSTPSHILCRENEHTKLIKFLDFHLKSKTAGAMYISGAPGTGKTACLQQFIQNHPLRDSFETIFINCMTMKQSKSIYEKISSELGCGPSVTIKDSTKNIEQQLTSKGIPVLIVLDEMDQLSTKNQDVLYTIFEWPRLRDSRLILIGIANALDLTDRLLPRLHACGSKPQLLHFMPYSQNQIQEILKDRLKEVLEQKSAIIKPEAIQFCARKIAASTGDVRKALDTCRRALEIAEKGAKSQQVLKTISDDGCNDGSPRNSPMKKEVSLTSVVGLPQIMSVLHDIYNSQIISSGPSKSSEFDATMPIQQKLLLCALLLLTKHGKMKDISIGKLHEVHCRICQRRQIGKVDPSEFTSLCDLVESRGLINVKKAKQARMAKVILKANEDDLQFVLRDKNLLATVLNDLSVLKP